MTTPDDDKIAIAVPVLVVVDREAYRQEYAQAGGAVFADDDAVIGEFVTGLVRAAVADRLRPHRGWASLHDTEEQP